MSMQFATKIFSSHIAWLGGKVRPTIAECYGMHFHCWGGLEYQKASCICATPTTPTPKGSSPRTEVKDIIYRSGGEIDRGNQKNTST
ncbi:hypothetical protein LINPERHAP1_LOCUS17777 [Linum perenne]